MRRTELYLEPGMRMLACFLLLSPPLTRRRLSDDPPSPIIRDSTNRTVSDM